LAKRKNEVEWTKGFLVNRLRQLGFGSIDFVHGAMEAGRDVVFSDRDRFGVVHYYAAQVKSGSLKARSETRELGSIIQQLGFAYETPYTDPASGVTHKIRGVYLIVDGEVSEPARKILNHRLGQWLHIVDRRHLDVAATLAVSTSDEERRSRIVAAKIELVLEKDQVPGLIENAKGVLAATETMKVHLLSRPIRTKALDRYLEIAHEELDPLDTIVLHKLRDGADIINFIVSRIPLGSMDQEAIQPTFESILELGKIHQGNILDSESLLDYALNNDRPSGGKLLKPWPDNPYVEKESGE